MLLKDKKILFISVKLFSIENRIKNKLESLGATVDYFDERPSNSIYAKGIIRLKRSFYEKKIIDHYNKILSKIKTREYDYLFVIKGEVIPEFFLKQFSETHLETKKIFYTWDSFKNNSHSKVILNFFDKKFTFDSDDAKKDNIELLPLFFFDSFRGLKKKTQLKYDLLFIGTAHSDRYILANKIVNWCDTNDLNYFTFFYMQGRLVYFFKKFFDPEFKFFDYKKMSFDSLSENEILTLYEKSNVILDINHPFQKGLTMRTLESVGAEKKLITTNKEIKNYSFYDPENILIVERNNIVLNKDFFLKPYKSLPVELYEELSIDGWIKNIFKEDKI